MRRARSTTARSALEEFAAIARDKSREGVAYASVGDAKAAMRGAAKVYQRRIPHALCLSRADGADERHRRGQPRRQVGRNLGRHPGPTQPAQPGRRALEIERSSITLHQHFLGGGFGRRAQQEVVVDAVRLSKAVGKPVKLIWSREDDMAFGKFRPMTAHHIEAGFDANGKLIAWHHRVVAESVAAL